jgi:hypothetical protein
LGVLVIILGALLMSRKDVDATVMRAPGILFQERGADSVSNLYTIKIANKTAHAIPLELVLEGSPGQVEIIGGRTVNLKKEDEGGGTFFVVLPKKMIHARKTAIRIGLYQGGRKIDVIKTNFLGPLGE